MTTTQKRQSKLSIAWTKNLRDQQAKEDFEDTVRNSVRVLERLREILEEMERSVLAEEASTESYKEGWQFLQAHRNGKKDTLRALKKLTDHLQEV